MTEHRAHGDHRFGFVGPGLEYLRLQGHSDRVLVYFPGITDALLRPRELLRRRQRLFRPWLRSRTVYIVSRRRPLPPDFTIAAMTADYAHAVEEIAVREGVVDGRLDVAGASFGGCIALQFALDHPQLLRRLVVQQAAGRGDEQALRTMQRWMAQLEQGRFLPFAFSFLDHTFEGSRRVLNVLLTLGLYPMLLNGFRERQLDVLTSMRALEPFQVLDRLADIETPTLVAGGTRDRLAPPYLLRETAQAIPRSTLVLFPDAGHSVHVEQTQAYGQALTDFLDGTSERAAPIADADGATAP